MVVELKEVCKESLEQMMSAEDYALTKDLVTAHLFSRYPERRDIALRYLRSIWENELTVDTAENVHETFAYIRFEGREQYAALVSIYDKAEEFPETALRYEERKLWELIASSKS